MHQINSKYFKKYQENTLHLVRRDSHKMAPMNSNGLLWQLLSHSPIIWLIFWPNNRLSCWVLVNFQISKMFSTYRHSFDSSLSWLSLKFVCCALWPIYRLVPLAQPRKQKQNSANFPKKKKNAAEKLKSQRDETRPHDRHAANHFNIFFSFFFTCYVFYNMEWSSREG